MNNPLAFIPTEQPRQEIERWLAHLASRDLLWHQDDDPADCLSGALHAGLLTDVELEVIATSHKAMWIVAELHNICPHEIAVELIK